LNLAGWGGSAAAVACLQLFCIPPKSHHHRLIPPPPLHFPFKTKPGDHQVIAKETARQLGLGTNIPDAANLPTMDADGKIPKDLGKKYGKMILEADGFAQVRVWPFTFV
jgi:hypothetical protein